MLHNFLQVRALFKFTQICPNLKSKFTGMHISNHKNPLKLTETGTILLYVETIKPKVTKLNACSIMIFVLSTCKIISFLPCFLLQKKMKHELS